MELTPKQQEFYAQLENTFMTPGWSLMVQGWKDEQAALPESAFFNAQNMDDIRAARVRYGLLAELIQLPEVIAQQKLNVIQEASEDG